jgi:tetratricopeptide (TPR) repeat protein
LSQYYIPFSAEAGISHTLPRKEAEAAAANIAMFEKMVQDAQTDGNWERTIQLLTEELNLKHTSEEVVSLCNALGFSYFMSGLPRQAEVAFKSGLAINPQDIDLLNNIASLYLQQEDYDKASDYVTRALRLDPHDVGVLGTLGECALKLAKFDVALQAYEQIKSLAPATDGIDQAIADLTRLADADAAPPDKNIDQT